MSYLVALLLLSLSGVSLLRLARLGTGTWLVDGPLGWLLGCGWFSLTAMLLRFLLGIPHGRVVALAIATAPIALWIGHRSLARQRPGPSPTPAALRFPRPTWLFGPLAAYVLLVLVAVLLHGANTPTHTDDAVRVRALTPILAFDDEWSAPARSLLMMAGPVTTFVPSLGWSVSGTLDHFHVNYFVGTSLAAFLLLAVGLASIRGAPERGWAQSFATLSIPLFVYHCTSTYSDAVLALFVAAGALFAMEYGRGGDLSDAIRAGLIWAAATMVKREGEVVAGSMLLLLLLQVGWRARNGNWRHLGRALAFLAPPVVLFAAGKVAAVGLAEAFPILSVLANAPSLDSAGAPGPAVAEGICAAAASEFGFALLRSWNAGMVFWLLPFAVILRPRLLRCPAFSWSLVTVTVLLGETAYVSIVAFPEFTIDQTTVHRALLVPALAAACWIAAVATEPA